MPRRFRLSLLCFALFFVTQLTIFGFLYKTVQAQTTNRPDLNILIDASGSMAEKIGVKTKMQIAQEAFASLIDSFPGDAKVGLRTYGSQSDKSLKDCKDTKLLVPISTINKESLKSESDKLAPKGYTPISYSLEQAYSDFGSSDTQRYIVLISDGEETCGGNPCQTAKDLAAKGVKTTINTVGFNVDAKAKEQLMCIANATGGTYQDATNLDQLNEGLKQATKKIREFINYTAEGQQIVGGSGFEQAAQLQTSLQYTSEILKGEELYYFLNIPEGTRTKTLKITTKQEQSNCYSSTIKIRLFGDTREDLNPSAGYAAYQNLGGVDSKVIDVQFDATKFDNYYKKSNKGVYFSISRDSPFTCTKQVTLTIQSETQTKVSPTPPLSVVTNLQDNKQPVINNSSPNPTRSLGTRRGNRNILLVSLVGIIILLILGGIAYWFFRKKRDVPPSDTQPLSPIQTGTPTPISTSVASGQSPSPTTPTITTTLQSQEKSEEK